MRKKLILDPTAPRYRPGYTTVANKKFFRQFFKENPEFVQFRKQFTDKELKGIIKHFNENLTAAAIDNRDGVLLPEQLGWLYLATIPNPKRRVNDKLSNELGYDVNFTNNHSDGKLLKIVHVCAHRSFNFENKGLWRFKASQNFMERASKEFSKKYMIYFPLEDRRAITQREKNFYIKENTFAPKKKKFKRNVNK